jgi:UDP-GlcNAc:undecaprenyl-phosphate GlcNAc-1-phosphate transferase
LAVAKGVFLGSLCAQLVILYVYRFFSYSRTVFAIDGVLLLTAVIVSRASFRLVGEFMRRQRRTGRRMIVYGAGVGGTLVLRELMAADGENVRIVGFIDDDPRKAGIRVQGYPVLGGYSALSVLLNAASVDGVVISTRRMSPERLNNLTVLCSQHQVPLTRLQIGLETIVEAESGSDAQPRGQLHHIQP